MHIVRKYALTMNQTQSEPSPIVDWQDGQPVSALYGDVYFSRESGIAETRYVFLQNNCLRERWQTLGLNVFTIGEPGFGTGLNFLCAWQLWREVAPLHARLHFVSTEKFRLAHDELKRALALWPELAPFSRLLLTQYKRIVPGWQRLSFDGGRVTLTLLVGDARETLPQALAQSDRLQETIEPGSSSIRVEASARSNESRRIPPRFAGKGFRCVPRSGCVAHREIQRSFQPARVLPCRRRWEARTS